MKFKIGDIANGVETSETIIEAKDELHALRQMIADANLYCYPCEHDGEQKNNVCLDCGANI